MNRPATHPLSSVLSSALSRARGLAAASLLLTLSSVHATDLGIIGPTYAITEPHLLRMIEQRLREKERSGELARLQQAARERAVAAVRQPAPVAMLTPTRHPRTFYIDPSFTLDRNVFDDKNKLMYAAGTRKNPLEVVSLSRRLLFFDARDKRQVESAAVLMARSPGRIKPILTAGSYLDLMQAWHIPIYYDQHGLLTRRLGITQVPALVSQEGLRLRVDEVEVQP